VESVKVGGETFGYCTSCRDMRLHVIVAMEGPVPAKAECRSCHRQHKFRAHPPGTKKEPAPRAPRVKSSSGGSGVAVATPAINPLEAFLSGKPPAAPRAYTPADRYAVGDILTHPNFGLGAVTNVPSPGKISVLFRDTTRLLLHERVTAPAQASKLQPPPRRDEVISNEPSARPPKIKSLL
jgi:hypothetical protein